MSVVPVRALARPAQLVEIELEAIDGAADQAHRVPQRLAEEDPFYRSFALRMGDRIWIGGAASPSALNGPQRETNVDAQTRRALSWMEERLAELGASLNDLVCTRTSLRDLADADAYREARRAVLGDTRPTSTLFGAGPFSDAGQRFEIDAEARVGVAESRVEFFGHEDRERSRGFALAVSAGEHVYVSGCNALDEQGRVVAPGDWAAQYDFCIQRIADLLERAGLTLGDVVQRRTLTVAGAKMNRGYGEGPAWFAASHPAALGCRVDALAHPDLVVEIDATAIRGAHAGIEWRSLDG